MNLNLQPIHFSTLGLNVDTGAIDLKLTANPRGGTLGRLLGSLGGSTTPSVAQINATLNGAQLLGGLDSALGRVSTKLVSATPANGATSPIANLALGPVNVKRLGLNVQLSKGANKPVPARLTATPGGGLLGGLFFSSITGGNKRPLAAQINNLLREIGTMQFP